MEFTEFRAAVLRAVPQAAGAEPAAADRTDPMYPFTFVSRVLTPAFVELLTGPGTAASQATACQLADAVEAVLATGRDETVDAIAMRLLEPVLCRRPELLDRAKPLLGPDTREAVGKLCDLISSADRAAVQARLLAD